jgi:glucosamine-6-phosphate deaminase
MNLSIHASSTAADEAAATLLANWLTNPGVRTVMLASGNTPIELYRRIAERKPALKHLTVFALDEYVGVPLDEPRNTANLLRRSAVEPWGIPPTQFFTVSSLEADALASIQRHERRITEAGGLDVIVLGLGQNGHLAFNEPGSAPDSTGRVLDLEPISIEANRKWFAGKYAPAKGATVGLKTILAARRVLILAYGAHKTAAAKAMVEGKVGPHCPASFLQRHPNVEVFLDSAAGAQLTRQKNN